jgi:hypothetical protein
MSPGCDVGARRWTIRSGDVCTPSRARRVQARENKSDLRATHAVTRWAQYFSGRRQGQALADLEDPGDFVWHEPVAGEAAKRLKGERAVGAAARHDDRLQAGERVAHGDRDGELCGRRERPTARDVQ